MQGKAENQGNWGRFPLAVWPVAAMAAVVVLILAPGGGAFRLGAGWLLLCFLPGISIYLTLDRRCDLFEQLAMGAAFSPVVMSVLLYLPAGLLHLPLTFSMVSAGVVCLGLLLFATLRRDTVAVPRPAWPGVLVFTALLLFVILVAVYFLKRPVALVDPHGLFHTAIIHQVMNGIIPPHNIHLYGAPTAYQWPCYFLPAMASLATGASPPVTAAMVRFSAILGIFGMGWLMARQLGQGAAGRALSGLFAALGMNLLAGAHYLAMSLSAPDLRYALFQGRFHPRLLSLFSPGLIPDYLQVRTSTLTLKLVNFSFILPGYVAVMVGLFGVILVLQGRSRKGYPLVVLGTLGALLIHPLLAAVLAFPLPLALFLLRLIRRDGAPSISWGRMLAVIGGLAISGLAALPYLVPEMRTSGGTGVSTGFSFGILLALVWVYAPLGLLAGYRLFRGGRQVTSSEWLLFLLAVCNAAFITVQQLKCEWYMLYLTAVPLGLLAGEAAGGLLERINRSWMRVAALLLVILVALSGPLLRLNYASLVQLEGMEKRFRILGAPMVELRKQESDLARAISWIRENTGPEDLLVEWPRDHSREELAALTGRRVFVGRPSVHTPSADDPFMSAALTLAVGLFDPARPDKDAFFDGLAELPETTYVVLTRHSLRGRFPDLAAQFSAVPHRLELCLDLPEAKLYRVRNE